MTLFADPDTIRERGQTIDEIRQEIGRDHIGTAALQAAAHDRTKRYRAAALLADRVYPAPIARLVKGELVEWCEYGYRLGVLPTAEALYAQVMADAAEKGLA